MVDEVCLFLIAKKRQGENSPIYMRDVPYMAGKEL